MRSSKKKIAPDAFDGTVSLAETLGEQLPPAVAAGSCDLRPDRAEEPRRAANSVASMHFRISIERKERAGKTVTLLTGFKGDESSRRALTKQLKNALGCGAAPEEDRLVLQGDQRERLAELLRKLGASKVSVV